MADAQKEYRNSQKCDDGDRVYIPDTLENSDSKNDSYSTKLQRLAGIERNAQNDEQEKGESSKQIWFMKETNVIPPEKSYTIEPLVSEEVCIEKPKEVVDGTEMEAATLSPKVFMSDDNIVNTQESNEVDEDIQIEQAEHTEDGSKADIDT